MRKLDFAISIEYDLLYFIAFVKHIKRLMAQASI